MVRVSCPLLLTYVHVGEQLRLVASTSATESQQLRLRVWDQLRLRVWGSGGSEGSVDCGLPGVAGLAIKPCRRNNRLYRDLLSHEPNPET